MTSTSVRKTPRRLEDVIADAQRDMQRREAMQKAAVDEALTKLTIGGIDNGTVASALPQTTIKPQIIIDPQVRPGSRSAPPPSTRRHKPRKSQRHPKDQHCLGEQADSTPVEVGDESSSPNVPVPTTPTTTLQTPIELEIMQPAYSPAEDKRKYIELHRVAATAVDTQDPKWEAWVLRVLLKHKLGVDDSAVNEYLTFMHSECMRLKEESKQSIREARNREIAQQYWANHAARQRYEQGLAGVNVRDEMRYCGQSRNSLSTVNGAVHQSGYGPRPGMEYGWRGRGRSWS